MAEAVQQLIETMQEELQCQQYLANLLDGKLEAMRGFDAVKLQQLNIAEQQMMDQVRQRVQRRTLAVRCATRRLLPQSELRSVSARQLAYLAPAGQKEAILALTDELLEVCEKVKRLNNVNAMATRKMMGHFDKVFNLIANSGCEVGLYSPSGKSRPMIQNQLVDARA